MFNKKYICWKKGIYVIKLHSTTIKKQLFCLQFRMGVRQSLIWRKYCQFQVSKNYVTKNIGIR